MNWKPGTISALAAISMLSACATTPNPPNDLFAQAESAIVRAQAANAAQTAPVEMKSAQDKLQAAKDLGEKAEKDSDENEMQHARWLATESKSDADLAATKAQAATATTATNEIKKGDAALQQELDRTQGVN